MKLYIAAGTYVGTQAEARGLDRGFTQVDVPTDKESLIDYLNGLMVNGAQPLPRAAASVIDEDDISDLLGDDTPKPMPMTFARAQRVLEQIDTASRVVSQIDTPGIEQIVEVIATAKGQSLRRFAGAVAVRFAELGK